MYNKRTCVTLQKKLSSVVSDKKKQLTRLVSSVNQNLSPRWFVAQITGNRQNMIQG